MKRSWISVAVLWVVLTALGFTIVFLWSPLPEQFSEEARVVDDAFLLLTLLAVPVFAFMGTALLYALLSWRVKEGEEGDGPPLRDNRAVVGIWLAITGALAVFVIINPGFVGLAAIRGEPSADLVVGVEASRWFWTITYPNGAVSNEELVVPVDQRIRFDVTATDILHSFWVPAFRGKIDAVPGRLTTLFVTPDRLGTSDEDVGLRLQCAELCGLGHARMAIPVRVVTPAEFETYSAGLVSQAAGSG